ncbi:type III pantothenate kinase [Porifericola rhodea]|uniref:type III pantothenate kinase n=1 Tax=Porifericola rhodea TaxID=930972 RepID=UPI0026657236|nr:type III pantothenate kinase [Porifericola rhodea]WKN32630.1 type III pantothenate kinase [Porifericola rhodea]
MENLVIDIGNTFAKAGLFLHGKLEHTYSHLPLQEVPTLIGKKSYNGLIISSVSSQLEDIIKVDEKDAQVIFLNANTPLPFINTYQTPRTLGTDRIAAIAGAIALFPDRPVLAIDAGTCITYDVADGKKNYLGGNISPGLQMRAKAMHTFTARLPLVHVEQAEAAHIPLIGYNTQTALQSGALFGTQAEITQMIRMYADKFRNLEVVLCGGDADLLSQGIDVAHTTVPELILIGLNRILEYNVS